MSSPPKFPRWFTLLTAVLVISNLFVFGIASLINPSLPWPDLGEAARFPIQFFAVRHIAFAFPLLYGLLSSDVKVLITCYSIFLIVAIIDVALLAIYGYYIPIIGELPFAATLGISISCFILPMGIALKHLSTYKAPLT